MSSRKRAFVRQDNTAEFKCPQCGEPSVISLEQKISTSTPVRTRFRCTCGSSHVVYLERRVSARYQVELPGAFGFRHETTRHPMTVRNLSRTGLMFEPEEPAQLEVGDRLRVEFCLEHAERECFSKEALVRRVDGGSIGAEFVAAPGSSPYDRVYDMALALFSCSVKEV